MNAERVAKGLDLQARGRERILGQRLEGIQLDASLAEQAYSRGEHSEVVVRLEALAMQVAQALTTAGRLAQLDEVRALIPAEDNSQG